MSEVLLIKAEQDQRRASAPNATVWVSASAGSGKTKVLTDRILRLLLSGVDPNRILAITFTKAAAALMATRLNETLAAWTVLDEATLTDRLALLTGARPTQAERDIARRLFARIVDAATGIRIQTIHGFCQSVLKRFPLEAKLSPHFTILDERSQADMLDQALDFVLTRAWQAPSESLGRALQKLTTSLADQTFRSVLHELLRARDLLNAALAHYGDPETIKIALAEELGIEINVTEQDIVQSASAEGAFDRAALCRAAHIMSEGKTYDRERGGRIAAWLASSDREAGFESYCRAYLTEKDKILVPFKTIMTVDLVRRYPDVQEALLVETMRLLSVRARAQAARLLEYSTALVVLGEEVLTAYRRVKQIGQHLDYDDLIFETCRLLADDRARWVLYKLDGGLDHILLDESQDTSPAQWQLVSSLADEFFAGEGSNPRLRTLFAVGDEKQSIFSFQGADPAVFSKMRTHFSRRVIDAEQDWQKVELDVSFRSVAPILSLVDAVFASETVYRGVAPEAPHHRCMRMGEGGEVELWPLVETAASSTRDVWTIDDAEARTPAGVDALAAKIADTIAGWLANKELLVSQNRPIQPKDVLILLRRRGAMMPALIRALTQRNVPVAGADRLKLSEELCVQDLVAFADFLLLPEDDLTLACVLKTPFIGFDEEALFKAAYNRPGSLWESMRAKGGDAYEWLARWRSRVDFQRPYELFSALLNEACPADPNGNGWRAMQSRLGLQAQDPLDEFLSAILAYEKDYVPSLQGALAWFRSGESEIRREQARHNASHQGEVAIMTVHGAKGLQAPIVFLADTNDREGKSRPKLLWTHEEARPSLPLLAPTRLDEDTYCGNVRSTLRQLEDEEYRRLLYVALTRAEDRLYVTGWGKDGVAKDGTWYGYVAAAMPTLDGARFDEARGIWKLQARQTETVKQKMLAETDAGIPVLVPAFARTRPMADPDPVRPLTPSRFVFEETPPQSPLQRRERDRRFERGRLIHRLLQTLPDVTPAKRTIAAERYLAATNLTEMERAQLIAETLAVIDDAQFGAIFGPGSQAEVPLTGLIEQYGKPFALSGQVDRLLISPTEILIVDFKTNRPPPGDATRVPAIYRAQLASYRQVLRQFYPHHTIRTALLWTYGPTLMEVV